MLQDFSARVLWAAVKAAFWAFLDMLGIRKRAADDGAAQQRDVNDRDNQKKMADAEKRHQASAAESDDELRARARRDWLQPGGPDR